MKTATSVNQAAMQERLVKDQLTSFFEKWKPECSRKQDEFHYDFHRLISSIYCEASDRYVQQLAALYRLIPPALVFDGKLKIND